jgi:hypothetical protein
MHAAAQCGFEDVAFVSLGQAGRVGVLDALHACLRVLEPLAHRMQGTGRGHAGAGAPDAEAAGAVAAAGAGAAGMADVDTPSSGDPLTAAMQRLRAVCARRAVLLVVSAIEGFGRQTHEHLRIAGLLGLPVEKQTWEAGREKIVSQLRAAGAKETAPATGQPGSGALASAYRWLTETPVFILIWFLWFLVWLVALFSVYALLAERFGWRIQGHWLVVSPANLLWLVPLTLAPTALMEFNLGIGPDTVMGILPMPHVLFYYALFFFFGVVYYDCDDQEGRLGGSWRWLLPVTLFIIFPLALEFATGTFGFREALLPAKFHRPASVGFQSLFAWAMSFASIGLFRSLLTRENPTIRYLSDSAYWLYLAHLPLCFAGQALISQWSGPAWIKLPLFTVALTAVLLLSYQYGVRYTWVGRLLNGPGKRPAAVGAGPST